MIILHSIEMKSISEVKYFFIDRSSKLKDQKMVLSFQWLRLHGATQGAQVCWLFREPRCCKKRKSSNWALHFKVYLVIYFVFGCAGSLLVHGLFCSCGEVGLLSSCGAWALGHVGFSSVAPGLWSTGSVVDKHRLSCSKAYGIFLDQGLNPCLLHWQAGSLPLIHQQSPLSF